MSLWESLKRFLALEPMQERAIDSFVDYPDLTTQLMAVQGLTPRPWRVASLKEALGVPAVFRAVTLIANTTGALSLEAFRNGARLSDTDRPRLIVRPDPFTTPRDFYRDTAYNMATRGEAWWWVAKRDSNGDALSLLTVNPAEVTVTANERDLRYPLIEWRGVKMRNEDMRQLTLLREAGDLRGMGPLQVCGAAISVTVEAQEWAANFFASGGYPSILLKSQVDLTEEEANALKAQWIETYSNMPKVTTPSVDVAEIGANPQGAQMLQARDYQTGDIARMFGIPASLLDHTTPGSSLTYQNLEGEFGKFVRACLWPNYLEPIEQAMSDLLTRSTVARFNLDALLRADSKTRYEVYKLGVESGVLAIDEARVQEGLDPGDVERATVPFAPPQAIPDRLPIQTRSGEVRCDGTRVLRHRIVACGKLLAEAGPFVGTCPRCKKVYAAPPPAVSEELLLTRQMAAAVIAMAQREQPVPNITVQAPPPAVVNVTVPEQAAPVVNVTVEPPAQPPNRHVELDGPILRVVNDD